MAFNLRGFLTPLNTFFSNSQNRALRDAFGYVANSYKRAAQTYSASTTFAEVTDLAVELPVGTHRVTFILATPSMTAAGGIKLQLVARDGLVVNTVTMSAYYWLTGVAPAVTPITALSSAVNGGTTNAWTSVLITGTVDVKDQGYLTLQAAQQAASGTTTVGAGSSVDTQQLTLAK